MSADWWTFQNPVRVIFGAGRLSELPSHISGKVLVVTTPGSTRRGLTDRVAGLVGSPAIYDRVQTNPAITDVEAAIVEWRDRDVQAVIGLGGGSSIDVAKVLSLALAAPDLTVRAWLDANEPWTATSPLPLVAVPTTAGTGSEVTPFATLWDREAKQKHSVGTPRLHPDIALIDPELAVSLPWPITLSSGLDAFSQSFEAICNRHSTPITTGLAERSILQVPDALLTLRDDPTSIVARTAMAEAALLSGLAISVTRTGLAHSISYPITAHLGVPHGLACALGLPAVLAFNAETDDGRLERLARLAGLDGVDAMAEFVLNLYRALGVPGEVAKYLTADTSLRGLAPEMLTRGRADNNIRPTSPSDLDHILAQAEAWLRRTAVP